MQITLEDVHIRWRGAVHWCTMLLFIPPERDFAAVTVNTNTDTLTRVTTPDTGELHAPW